MEPDMTTAKEIHERYNVRISPQRLGAFRAAQRRAKGPPFRMAIEYPLPVLTPAEEAEALAQAEYDDEMGNFAWEPGTYIVLHAQNAEDAKAEAERIWHTEPRGADAIGYVLCSRDWRHVYSFISNTPQGGTE
jgi:hypothetical protein